MYIVALIMMAFYVMMYCLLFYGAWQIHPGLMYMSIALAFLTLKVKFRQM